MEAIEIVLKEMCDRVGADVESVDFKEHGWYFKHSWTQEEEEEFVQWLADKLKNKEFRNSLLKFPSLYRMKSGRLKAAKEFVMFYGWKTYTIRNNSQ